MTPATPPAFALSAPRVRQCFEAGAARLAGQDFLAREVASRMAERLSYIRHTPQRVLDLGCGHGPDLGLLAQQYPHAAYLGLDLTLPLLRRARPQTSLWQRWLTRQDAPAFVCADAGALPLANASVDMVWSNLLLHWLPDPAPALRELQRVMRSGGLLMFATLGPDTFSELRRVLPGAHLHAFIDMHDLGDTLLQAGFAEPVMDMQRLTLTYPDVDSLLRELRSASAGNARGDRPRGLGRRSDWQAARNALEAARQPDGRLPLSIELVFGHAWRAAPRETADGRAIMHFQPRAAR